MTDMAKTEAFDNAWSELRKKGGRVSMGLIPGVVFYIHGEPPRRLVDPVDPLPSMRKSKATQPLALPAPLTIIS